MIALEEVASAEIRPGTSVFRHYDGERSITITGEIVQEKTTPIKVTDAVLNHFNLNRDYPGMRRYRVTAYGGPARVGRTAGAGNGILAGVAGYRSGDVFGDGRDAGAALRDLENPGRVCTGSVALYRNLDFKRYRPACGPEIPGAV